jgi:hypothetical protein
VVGRAEPAVDDLVFALKAMVSVAEKPPPCRVFIEIALREVERPAEDF